MGFSVVRSDRADFPDAVLARLSTVGLDVRAVEVGAAAGASAGAIADAISLADGAGALAAVAERSFPDRQSAEAALAATADVRAERSSSPVAIVVLPAVMPPVAGPVAVLSPAESVSAYELYLAAGLAAGSGRRVVHLNGRGTRASAVHSGLAARALARAAAPAWAETTHAHPDRALRTLAGRPGAVVVAVPPGSLAAASVIVDHPDADVVLVFDRAHAHRGAAVGEQVGAMVELGFGLGARTEPDDVDEPDSEPASTVAATPADDPVPDLPPIRASDVVHIRLTSDALEVTNRTDLALRLRVSLGSVSDRTAERAAFETELSPRSDAVAATADVPGLVDLEPPHAEMRHWSHTSEEVFEGGEQRMLGLRLEVLDARGRTRAERTYVPGNGLDYFVTARDLLALVGRPSAGSVLPAPTAAAPTGEHARDVLGAFARAVEVGATMLSARAE